MKGNVGGEECDEVMMSCLSWEYGNRVMMSYGTWGHDVMIYVV